MERPTPRLNEFLERLQALCRELNVALICLPLDSSQRDTYIELTVPGEGVFPYRAISASEVVAARAAA